MDSEQFSRVVRVTEIMNEGYSQRLENFRVEETPMVVVQTTDAWTFTQSASEEWCVKVLHIKARLLVAPVLDICTSKTEKQGSSL